MHRIAKIALLFCAAVSTLYAQENTSLQISVVDQYSKFLPQAIVLLKTEQGKIVKEINADDTQAIVISRLAEGKYILEVQSVGFEKSVQNINLKKGNNLISVQLEVAEIRAEVEVTENQIEKRLDEAFNTTLTAEQIDSLPDDPSKIEEELKRRYGDDVLIRVDGFTGGTIPPKQQIASIRITRSGFDAEFHEIGQTIIDISTKAGGKLFFGTVFSNFNHSILNARNPLDKEKLFSRNNSLFGIFIFPSINKDRTSFSATFFGNNFSRAKTITAQTPNSAERTESRSGYSNLSPEITVIHNINDNHTLRVLYGFDQTVLSNAGIGGFSLPERAFSSNSTTHKIRFSESGVIRKTANQFRLEFTDATSKSLPENETAAINVLGAFSGGGSNVNNSSRQQRLFLTDINYFDWKKHAFKIGAEFEYIRYNLTSADNLNGRFVFSNLADFLSNTPYSFTQRQSTTTTNLSQIQFAGFVQDDVRLRKNFQIGLGLRYEWQNNLKDSNNFSPRLSFTWSPDRNAKLVLRSGAGIFYHWFETPTLSTILSNDGRNTNELVIIRPSYPNPFQAGVISQSLPPSVMRKADGLKNSYTFITKTGFNYRINNQYRLESFYTYRKSVHQFRSRDINAPINGVRPDINFGRIIQVESSGNAVENSLELRIEGRLKKGFSFDANYKLAKISSDYEGVFDLPMNNYNTGLEWGAADVDQRHKFNSRLTFPSWNSVSFNTTFRLESPKPYTITTGIDNNADSFINDRPFGFQRNSERGDWFKQVDASLSWRKKLGKTDAENPLSKHRNQLGITLTAQNLFNQTNKQNFIGIQTSPFFQQAITAFPSRTIQFGLSYFF